MMTTKRLAEVLGVEAWPAEYDGCFERFSNEWETVKTEPMLDMDAVNVLCEQGFINAEQLGDVEACLALIEADEELHFAMQCVYYSLVVYRSEHENELYIDPVPPSLEGYGHTFSMIVLMKLLVNGVKKARERGIPEELIAQHKGAADGGLLESGHYGTPGMFHWRCVCAFATMYQLGAFRYEPERVPPGYRMVRRKKDGKLLMLFTAARSIDEYGQFVSPDLEVFKTTDAVSKTDGYIIAPDGCVIDRYVALPETEWETVFDGGDHALSFHIPSGIPYHAQALVDSFKQAVEFFGKYYPDANVRSIQSYSWLYSPQLRFMLAEGSGINRLNRELYLAPVPSGPDGFYSFVFQTDGASFDIETVEANTSLKRGFVGFVKNGGRVHNGFVYYPTSDIDRLCEEAHTLYAWDMLEE